MKKIETLKKIFIFLFGLFCGSVIVPVCFLILKNKNSQNDYKDVTIIEDKIDTLSVNSFKVFQVLYDDAALATGKNSELNEYNETVYLLTNEDGHYYYDDEVVNVNDNCAVVKFGIYQYETSDSFIKNVPIVKIVDK